MPAPPPANPSLRQIFAKNMRKIRESQNKSQESLADICELHRTFISMIERGKQNISIDNIEKIANGLNISPIELIKPLDADE